MSVPEFNSDGKRRRGRPRKATPAEPPAHYPGRPDPDVEEYMARHEATATASDLPPDFQNAFAAEDFRKALVEVAKRKVEALNLYEPLPEQLRYHASRSRIRLLRGSNRGGKTLPACVEVARAVTGKDPFDKFPKANGRLYAVGKDLNHVGQVMWRKLGRAGAFRILRDEQTNEWRSYRPWAEYDVAYKEKSREAPPLVPPRFIKEISWESKKDGIPKGVRLVNGWEINFYSSLGKPPQGMDLTDAWFDEEIVDSEWFPEISARLMDHNGRLTWSATPQAGTDQLFELHEKADKQRLDPTPQVSEFVILLADNPHITEEAKREFAENLSDEDYRVRVGGDFALTSFKVYPEFSMLAHGRPYQEIPPAWTRYLAIDPGLQVCAVLFGAVPPSDDDLWLYDELYIQRCNADTLAQAVAEKAKHQTFQAFVIDYRGSIRGELGVGKTVHQQYTEAFHRHKVQSVATGSGFVLGSDDVDAGILKVHDFLRIRPDGTARLRVLENALPNFLDEIKRYHNKRVRTAGGYQVLSTPDQRKGNHLMDALRYLCMFDPRYVKQPERKPANKKWWLEEKRRRRERDAGSSVMLLGPGATRA